MASQRVIAPNVGHDDEFFWDGVKEGVLRVRQCAQCGFLQHPPSPMCPECGSVEWAVRDTTGRGTVLSWIVSRHPTDPEAEPRIVVLLELSEGIRFVTNLQGVSVADVDGGTALNGLDVEVFFDDFDGVVLPQARPARVA